MYQNPIYFAGCDLSVNQHVRLAAYLREMQKVACLDLKNFDLSPEQLYELGIAFILSKTSLRIHSQNLDTFELDLKTYPRQTKGASFMRDFIFTQGDRSIASATTRWGILNLETRTLCRPKDLPTPIQGEADLWVGFEPPRLCAQIPENARDLGKVQVAHCMTDANGHLNNAAYLDLCLEKIDDIPYNSLDIEYRHEAMVGEQLSLWRVDEDSEHFLLYGKKEAGDEICFMARLGY